MIFYSLFWMTFEFSHSLILRWVQHYVLEFEKQWSRFACPVHNSWRVDETYIRIRDVWNYLYRAVDKQGNTIEFMLSAKRDFSAAKRFFKKMMRPTIVEYV